MRFITIEYRLSPNHKRNLSDAFLSYFSRFYIDSVQSPLKKNNWFLGNFAFVVIMHFEYLNTAPADTMDDVGGGKICFPVPFRLRRFGTAKFKNKLVRWMVAIDTACVHDRERETR